MKITLQSLCVVLATVSCTFFASCTKDETQAAREVNGTVSIKITGEIGEFYAETKGSIVNSVRLGWSANDVVYVYNGSTYLGSLTAPATIEDDRVAELSGTITAPATTPATLTFVSSNTFTDKPTVTENTITVDLSTQTDAIPFVVYGKADYTSTGISNLIVPFKFATSAVKVSVTKLEQNVAISKAILLGVNTKCVLTLGESGAVTVAGSTPGVITRTETSKSASAGGYAFIEMGVPVSAANADRSVAVYQNSIHSGKALTGKIEESKYVNSITELLADALPGLFSVSSTTKVRFSKGNLQYLGTGSSGAMTPQWRFANHQYDFMGAGPDASSNKGNVTVDGYSTYNTFSENPGGSETDADKQAARDLFGWGTTGYQDTRTSSTGYQTNYQPYSTSKTAVGSSAPAYNINRYGYGPDYDNTNKYGLTVASKSDWGYCMGGETSVWRTLSGMDSVGEWEYLLNTRSQTNRFAMANVENVKGLIIFPDGYNGTTKVTGIDGIAEVNTTGAYKKPMDFPTTPIESNTWTIMESAGCVFLPAAGLRGESSNVGSVGKYGRYWSSTNNDYWSAENLIFSPEGLRTSGEGFHFYLQSVRLVSDVQ